MKSETHMSNLKLPNMSYSNLHALLKSSGRSRIKLAYATEVVQEALSIAVLHHENRIARVWPTGRVSVDTCGWDSVTTSNRLNRIVVDNALPYRVAIRAGATVLLTSTLAPVCRLYTATFENGVLV